MKLTTITYHKSYETEQLIDWCLTPTLAVFQLYHGVANLTKSIDHENGAKGQVTCT